MAIERFLNFKSKDKFVKCESRRRRLAANGHQLLRSLQHDAEVDVVGVSLEEAACSEGQSVPGSQSEQLGS